MVECVDGDGSPPYELRMAWECERWNCLPEDGGYNAQDYFLLRRMTALSNIYNALTHMRNSKGAEIHSLTENERKILKYLVDMGFLFNG